MTTDSVSRDELRRMAGNFAPAIDAARERLAAADPTALAASTGVEWTGGAFRFPYFDREARVTHPDGACELAGRPAAIVHTVLLLHFVLDGRAGDPAGHWISFREIPDSGAYHAAFQDRGPNRIARVFGDDPDGFAASCEALGARRDEELPGLAYVVRALPAFPLALVLHEGEPGLPAGGQILFDAAAPSMWCAEDLAVLGEVAAERLVRVR